MKFSGNVSFINIMILSKFQVDWTILTDFGIFLNIGKFEIFVKFWHWSVLAKDPVSFPTPTTVGSSRMLFSSPVFSTDGPNKDVL